MKKLLSIISLLLLFAFSLSAATISSPAATVNLTKNKVISMDTLNSEYDRYTSAGYTVTKLDVLNALIDEILIDQGAARDGYSVSDSDAELLYAQQKTTIENQLGASITDDEFKTLVEEQYESVDAYKTYLKRQYLTQMYVYGVKSDVVNNVTEPTEKEIKAWYRQNSSSFMMPERVRLSVIAIEKTDDAEANKKNLATLESAYSQIKAGTLSFEKAVQTYSGDTASKSSGGDWGFMSDTATTRTSMGDDFVDAVMLMDAGDIEGVFDTPSIYCIVKCTVHKDAEILALDDTIEDYNITVYNYIYQGLTYQNSQYAYVNAYNELVAELRTQAKINILYKEQ